MAEIQHYDVVIAGGGMVGLSLALALASSPLRVALVDQMPAVAVDELRVKLDAAEFDTRVSALTPATAAFLTELGVWRELESLRACAYTDMHVWDADGTGSIHFAAADMHVPSLGHIVENNLVGGVLAAALQRAGTVAVFQPDSLENLKSQSLVEGPARQVLELSSGHALSCRLLIGADGGSSRVRQLAGFATREWEYGHQAIVATVKTERPHLHTAWQRFMQTGPLAFLPLEASGGGPQHHCSIVWSCLPELAQELLALDERAFARRLEQAFEYRLGKVEHVSGRQSFPLRQKHASDYVQNGVALVGDAAHTIHPLAGQGVNLGFADVQSLAGVLTRAAARGEDFASHQVLSRYQRERQAANLSMMLVMEGFKRTFGSDNLALRWLRNAGLRAADTLTPFKHEIMSRAMGLKQ